ncbi:MAG: lysophospholipid acyltransferase family protein [Planctomycetes bacterium]|nr:lysophospholipid acyltransferase family protein [Planctomycetota bacterium]
MSTRREELPIARQDEDEPRKEPAAPKRRSASWRRPWKRLRRRIGLVLVRLCGPFVLGRLARTWKLQVLGEEHLQRALGSSPGHFMALWHGRMVLGLPHHGKRDWHVLVSPSADGDISQRLLEGFRYAVIRGSSSRGGARALREMLNVLERGSVLVITPDGPRGPRHAMNPGLAWMARATGYPVVPVGFGVDRAWRLKSWDRFTLPKPGARIAMVYGEPVRVPRDAKPEDLERATRAIHDHLIAAEQRGFEHLGVPIDW